MVAIDYKFNHYYGTIIIFKEWRVKIFTDLCVKIKNMSRIKHWKIIKLVVVIVFIILYISTETKLKTIQKYRLILIRTKSSNGAIRSQK